MPVEASGNVLFPKKAANSQFGFNKNIIIDGSDNFVASLCDLIIQKANGAPLAKVSVNLAEYINVKKSNHTLKCKRVNQDDGKDLNLIINIMSKVD